MQTLQFRVRLRDGGPRFAQAEAQLAKQALALPHAKADSALLLDPSSQGLAVPDGSPQPGLSRRVSQHRVGLLELLFIQSSGSSRSFSLY